MLSGLRDGRGGKTLRMRLLAVLIVVAMVGAAAPLIVSVVRWLFDALAAFLF